MRLFELVQYTSPRRRGELIDVCGVCRDAKSRDQRGLHVCLCVCLSARAHLTTTVQFVKWRHQSDVRRCSVEIASGCTASTVMLAVSDRIFFPLK